MCPKIAPAPKNSRHIPMTVRERENPSPIPRPSKKDSTGPFLQAYASARPRMIPVSYTHLGLKAKDDDYRNQYVGKNCESLSVTKSGSASDTEINAISGATITSNATTNAVSYTHLDVYKRQGKSSMGK